MGKHCHEPPKKLKKKGFGHLKTRLFTIKTSKHVGFGAPIVVTVASIRIDRWMMEIEMDSSKTRQRFWKIMKKQGQQNI